jgi:alkanesulfonate monooxygenase SsuD/methylene tetrahydromethanopterin reductase-like flavin-dependent oxidoreductase (luciferase family)
MKLGIQVTGAMSAEELLAHAAAADRLRLDRYWIAENPYEQSAAVVGAAVAVAHPELDLGVGIVSARLRHPVVLAQDYLAMANFSRASVILGLGVGFDSERIALSLPRRSGLKLLSETISVLRRLGRGESVPSWDADLAGTVGLRFAARPLPIYVGAIGPKTLKFSGREADGVILSKYASLSYIEEAVTRAIEARREVGEAETFGLVGYTLFGGVVGREEASRRLKPPIAGFLRELVRQPAILALWNGLGRPDEFAKLARWLEEGSSALDVIPDELVDELAIWGEPDRCVEGLRRYRAAGLKEVALGVGRWLGDAERVTGDVEAVVRAWRSAEVGESLASDATP